MGGFEDIDESILAGASIENEDIGTSAAINTGKFEKRTLNIQCNIVGAMMVGTGAVISSDVNSPSILMPNANLSLLRLTSSFPRGEVSPGEKLFMHIIWKSSGTSGNVKFNVSLGIVVEDSISLTTGVAKSIISPAQGSANLLQEAVLEFPPSIFGNNQSVGFEINRSPADALDTLASDISIVCIYFEMQGRC